MASFSLKLRPLAVDAKLGALVFARVFAVNMMCPLTEAPWGSVAVRSMRTSVG